MTFDESSNFFPSAETGVSEETQAQVDANEQVITINTTATITNTEDIVLNTGRIVVNEENIALNTAQAESNTLAIASNLELVQTNIDNRREDRGILDSLSRVVSDNATAIITNRNNLNDVTTRVVALETADQLLTEKVAQNEADVTLVNTALTTAETERTELQRIQLEHTEGLTQASNRRVVLSTNITLANTNIATNSTSIVDLGDTVTELQESLIKPTVINHELSYYVQYQMADLTTYILNLRLPGGLTNSGGLWQDRTTLQYT